MSSMSETTDGVHDAPSTIEQLPDKYELQLPLQEPPIAIATDLSYLTGGRLHLMTLGLCFGLYLVNVEVTIISTSLLAITNDLNGYRQAGWVLTSYLLTYTGFIIIWAKLSDILGRKTCTIASLAVFTIFSGACGGAQTMKQLIIFRAFQGLGAAGGFALTILVINEMVPRSKLPMYGAIMALDMALATLSGPLFGGVISDHSTWRWVFLMNVPGGAAAVAILVVAMPAGFPNYTTPPTIFGTGNTKKWSLTTVAKRLDLPGLFLLLAASLLLTTALLEGGSQWAWSSGTSIALLVTSGLLWISFFIWERTVTLGNWSQEPLFPWRFLSNRAWMGVLFTSLLNGLPFYILVINIPQRFQTVNGFSPISTGIRLLAFTLVASIGGIIANLSVANGRIPVIYVALFFSATTAIGSGLLTTLPTDGSLPKAVYAYEALAGLGGGATFALVILLVPYVVETRDLATANGALIEFRILGGAIGLAIVASALENYLDWNLRGIISPEQRLSLKESTSLLHELPDNIRGQVVRVFAEGFSLQMKITTAFASLQIAAIGMFWKKKQITVERKK